MSLTVAALGIVYGDIGTSPLYALRESLLAVQGFGTHTQQVLGVLSLIVWSLVIVVTLKYVVFILRAETTAKAAYWRSHSSRTARPAWAGAQNRCSRGAALWDWRSFMATGC